MIGQRNFHHFQKAVAKFVGGEERTIRPAGGAPGYVGLRLQLRQEDELALVCLTGVEHVLQEEGANGDLGRNCFAGTSLRTATTICSLMVLRVDDWWLPPCVTTTGSMPQRSRGSPSTPAPTPQDRC
jgi:hypothetical protein